MSPIFINNKVKLKMRFLSLLHLLVGLIAALKMKKDVIGCEPNRMIMNMYNDDRCMHPTKDSK